MVESSTQGLRRTALRRTSLAVILATAALGAAYFLLVGIHRPKLTLGPLYDPAYQPSSIGFPIDSGAPFTFGYSMLTNSGTKPAVIQTIRLRNPSSGFKLINAYIAPADRRAEVPANARTFKNKPFYVPAAGSTLDPGQPYIVVLELEVVGNGSFTTDGTLVEYSAGGSAYEQWIPDLIRVCAPKSNADCATQPLPTPTG